jgi:molybdenum cofactor sulfurtransferase
LIKTDLVAEDEDYKRAHEKLNPHRFRPNLVISGGEPYGEDKWKTVKIGDNHFTVSPWIHTRFNHNHMH